MNALSTFHNIHPPFSCPNMLTQSQLSTYLMIYRTKGGEVRKRISYRSRDLYSTSPTPLKYLRKKIWPGVLHWKYRHRVDQPTTAAKSNSDWVIADARLLETHPVIWPENTLHPLLIATQILVCQRKGDNEWRKGLPTPNTYYCGSTTQVPVKQRQYRGLSTLSHMPTSE